MRGNNKHNVHQGKGFGSNLARSFLTTDSVKDNSMKQMLFDNGNSMEFFMVKDLIEARLKSVKGDGFRLVDINNNKVIQTETQEEMILNQGANIVENNVQNTFGLEGPSFEINVEQEINNRIQRLNDQYAVKTNSIAAIYGKNQIEQVELLKAFGEFEKESNNILTIQRDNLKKSYYDEERYCDTKRKELEEMQSATVREFYNIFGTSIIQWIVEDLKSYRFRRAFFRICCRFEKIDGNRSQAVTGCIKILQTSNFDPWGKTSFREFFQCLLKVNKKLKVLGTDFGPEVFSDYFFDAMRRVDAANIFLNDRIQHWKYTVIDKSYDRFYLDLEAAFDTHFTNYLDKHPTKVSKFKRHFEQASNTFDKNPKFTKYNEKPGFGKKCINCGSTKYNTEDCECITICAYCGIRGHGDWRCIHNKDSKYYSETNNAPKQGLATYPGRISQGKFAKNGNNSSNNVKVTNDTILKHDTRRGIDFGHK